MTLAVWLFLRCIKQLEHGYAMISINTGVLSNLPWSLEEDDAKTIDSR